MMRKRCYLPLFLFFVANHICVSQVSVDLLTGAPRVSIPIYNLRSNDLQLPVVLGYNPGAVRNDNSESWVGMGWSLNPGGFIGREVKDIPDDIDLSTHKGWLSGTVASDVAAFTPTADTNLAQCSDELNDYQNLLGFYDNGGVMKDLEPDVYYFNFAGYSGQFVFDNNKSIKTIPYMDLKITPVFSGSSISSFEVTTPNGIIYEFSDRQQLRKSTSKDLGSPLLFQREHRVYSDTLTYVTDWYLSKITSFTGAFINFSYISSKENETSAERKVTIYSDEDESYVTSTVHTTNLYSWSKVIKSITSSSGVRLAFEANPKPDERYELRVINVFRGFELVQSHLFNYIEPRCSDNQNNEFLMLKSITRTYNCLKDPPYSFEYGGISTQGGQQIPFPCLDVGNYDFWGNLNSAVGNTSSEQPPQVYVYKNLPAAQRYRLAPIPGNSNYQLIPGADRSPSTSNIGMLRKVILPGGGSTRISYEQNQYFDDYANTTLDGKGLRVAETTTSDEGDSSEPIVTQYDYENNLQSTGYIKEMPNFIIPLPYYQDPSDVLDLRTLAQVDQIDPNNDDDVWQYLTARSSQDLADNSGQVYYKKIKVIRPGKGYTEHTFNYPVVYGDENVGGWSAPETLIARDSGCPEYGKLGTGSYEFPYATPIINDYAHGSPDEVLYYTESGFLKRKVKNNYALLSINTNPDMVKALKLEAFSGFDGTNLTGYVFSHISYDIATNFGYLPNSVITTDYDEWNSGRTMTDTLSLHYYSDLKLHKEVRQDGNGVDYVTEYVYPTNYNLSQVSDTHAQAIEKLVDEHRVAGPVEIIQHKEEGANTQTLGATLQTYKAYTIDQSAVTLPESSLSLALNGAVTNFTTSAISGGDFQYDSRYVPLATVHSYQGKATPLAVYDHRKRQYQGTLLGYNDNAAVASVLNGRPGEVAFEDFEAGGNNDFDFTGFMRWDSRSGQVCLAYTSGGISATVDFYDRENYRLSFWLKSSAAGNMTIKLLYPNTTIYSQSSLTYPNTNDEWQYLEKTLPTGSFTGSSLTVEILPGTAGLVFDDIIFKPETAVVNTTSYSSTHLSPTSNTDDNGNAIYYEYDALDRLLMKKDDAGNIREFFEVGFENLPIDINAGFDAPINVEINTISKFEAVDCGGLNYSYSWSIVELDNDAEPIPGTQLDFPDHSALLEHTFPSVGEYKVSLVVDVAGQGQASSYQTVTADFQQLAVEICANGPITVDLCNPNNDQVSSCGVTSQPNMTIFSISQVSNTLAGEEITYAWKTRKLSENFWGTAGTNDMVALCGRESFYVKCEIEGNDASRVAESAPILISVYKSDPTCPDEAHNYCRQF